MCKPRAPPRLHGRSLGRLDYAPSGGSSGCRSPTQRRAAPPTPRRKGAAMPATSARSATRVVQPTRFFRAALLAAPLAGLVATAAVAQQAKQEAKRALTFDDFAAVRAVTDPRVSPDGARVLYAVRTTDLEANRRTTTTFVRPIAGGAARAFPDDTTHGAEARWSPDGRRVAFVAGGQLWVADADGGNRRQLTTLTGGATGPVWAPTGDRVAFASAVYPECSDDPCNAARAKAKSESKVKAHVADHLMYRHWNAWDEGTRSHLFVVGMDGPPPRDLTPRAGYDVPPGPFGGSEGYAWSPDGRELTYSAKDQGRVEAWTTDVNLYAVPAAGGAPK